MSVVVYKALVCDCEAFHRRPSNCDGESTHDWTLREARQRARTDGWIRTSDRRDLCPKCVNCVETL